MKFALLVYEDVSEFESRISEPEQGDYWGAYSLYAKSLAEAGVAAGGNALREPQLATTVTMKGRDVLIQDGPFADTKEQLGGLFVIDVPTLDDALEWARRCPSVTRGAGSVEVRPLLEMGNP